MLSSAAITVPFLFLPWSQVGYSLCACPTVAYFSSVSINPTKSVGTTIYSLQRHKRSKQQWHLKSSGPSNRGLKSMYNEYQNEWYPAKPVSLCPEQRKYQRQVVWSNAAINPQGKCDWYSRYQFNLIHQTRIAKFLKTSTCDLTLSMSFQPKSPDKPWRNVRAWRSWCHALLTPAERWLQYDVARSSPLQYTNVPARSATLRSIAMSPLRY